MFSGEFGKSEKVFTDTCTTAGNECLLPSSTSHDPYFFPCVYVCVHAYTVVCGFVEESRDKVIKNAQ